MRNIKESVARIIVYTVIGAGLLLLALELTNTLNNINYISDVVFYYGLN